MPYIPLHLRVCEPVAAMESRQFLRPRRLADQFKPQASPVLNPPQRPENELFVEFARYHGTSFTHLTPHELYTLTRDRQYFSNISLENTESHSSVSGNAFAKAIADAMGEAIKNVLDTFRLCLAKYEAYLAENKHDKLVPVIWLRFGKLFFRSTYPGCFDWSMYYTPESVKRKVSQRMLLKTFDPCLSKEEFKTLYRIAKESSDFRVLKKERFSIKVTDEQRPETHLSCKCLCSPPSATGNYQTLQSGDALKDPLKAVLELKKVRLSPVRHMIGDVACIGKTKDIRLAFQIEEELIILSEDELADIKSTFINARIEESCKGGLHWPLHNMSSTSGRFKVVEGLHMRETLVMSGGLRWSFRRCNGVKFEACSGRVSYEVYVKPAICQEFCKGREQFDSDKLMESIERLLEHVSTYCL
ncbi:hypothetical protein GOP47_0005067 [Adiantum capillus-veneris]|uniref:DUF7903 domain-containing protein n=1 Tax=Adiantum capillus-veneris TaxID=13818 RepID=A0A9D4V4N6_ADICA|nr:hypothetical protein GOP47_0005067 [Adiantum capillus-veneris]